MKNTCENCNTPFLSPDDGYQPLCPACQIVVARDIAVFEIVSAVAYLAELEAQADEVQP